MRAPAVHARPSSRSRQSFSGAAATTSPVQLMISTTPVTPSFVGLSSAGLYQLSVTIPGSPGTGDVPLVAMAGGLQTQSGVVISFQ